MSLILQHAFLRAKNIVNPSSTGAVLCGQRQMQEVCIFAFQGRFT